MNDHHEQKRTRGFNARQVDLIKLDRAVDCQILIEEIDFAIDSIKARLASGIDADWAHDCTRALSEYQHKRKLAVMKLDALMKVAA